MRPIPTTCLMILILTAVTVSQPLANEPSRFLDERLIHSDPIKIDVAGFLADAKAGGFSLTIGGQILELELEEYSLSPDGIRAYNFDGVKKTPIPHTNPTSFRGSVRGYPDSHLHLTVCWDLSWVRGYVAFGEHWYFIEPRTEETPATGQSVLIVYQPHDVPAIGDLPDQEDSPAIPDPPAWQPPSEMNRENVYIYPVIDTQYYNINPDNWVDRMSAQVGMTASIYLNNNIVAFVAPEFGTYTGTGATDSYQLLNYLRIHFCSNFPGRRHLVHLLSGKDFDENIYGRAYDNAIGRNYGYSVVQCVATAYYTATDYQRVMIASHEIGHNLSATHGQATTVAHWNILCGFVGYTIMFGDWRGDCTVNYFSGPNASSMRTFSGVMGMSHPGDSGFSINDGALYTNSTHVYVSAFCPTFHHVTSSFEYFGAYCFSNNQNEGQPLQMAMEDQIDDSLDLPSGDGLKEVFFFGYDINDHDISTSDTIILDTTAPGPVASLASGSHVISEDNTNRTVEVAWEAAFDQTSGLAGYSILWSQDGEAVPDEEAEVTSEVLAATSSELPNGLWYFSVRALDNSGLAGPTEQLGPFSIVSPSEVDIDGQAIPATLTLLDNYPDPFNPSTTIAFGLPREGRVNLQIFNVFGQVVRTLLDENLAPGFHEVLWNGRDDRGETVASGVYFYKIEGNGVSKSKKMVLVK